MGFRKLRIWSAASSSGEEAYTMAMILLEKRATLLKDWIIEIVGTDINETVIAQAKEGIYNAYSVRNIPDVYKRKYIREDNGKFILLGLFEAINAKAFPATHPALFVANRWCKGEGRFSQKVRIINTKDKSVVFQTDDQPFELPDIDHHHTLISRFNNLVFPSPGKYWVEVLLDNELVINYPIMLNESK